MNINRANRQVADVLILDGKTKELFLDFKTANTTTTNISSDSVYARAKGARRIAFPNAPEGTLAIEAQIYPFKMYSLFSDGTISANGVYAETKKIKATEEGTLTIGSSDTIQSGTVFVYPEDSEGDKSAVIAGTFASGTFTATTASQIKVNDTYVVSYVINKSGVQSISFNSKKNSKDYFITMSTLDKNEDGQLVPFKQTFYKATPQRSFDLALSSEGDPASLTITFDLLEDEDGNFVDLVEMNEETE